VQIAAAKSGGLTSVEGFRGKRVALGPEGSGTEQNALQALDVYGLKVTDLARADRIDPAAAWDRAGFQSRIRGLRVKEIRTVADTKAGKFEQLGKRIVGSRTGPGS
jgi:ABC-type nitrate/sulfonate/bicarbonate transport system substrate-binding protein